MNMKWAGTLSQQPAPLNNWFLLRFTSVSTLHLKHRPARAVRVGVLRQHFIWPKKTISFNSLTQPTQTRPSLSRRTHLHFLPRGTMMLSTATSCNPTVRPSRGQRGWGLKVDARRTVQSLSATGKVRLRRTRTFDRLEVPTPQTSSFLPAGPARQPQQLLWA